MRTRRQRASGLHLPAPRGSRPAARRPRADRERVRRGDARRREAGRPGALRDRDRRAPLPVPRWRRERCARRRLGRPCLPRRARRNVQPARHRPRATARRRVDARRRPARRPRIHRTFRGERRRHELDRRLARLPRGTARGQPERSHRARERRPVVVEHDAEGRRPRGVRDRRARLGVAHRCRRRFRTRAGQRGLDRERHRSVVRRADALPELERRRRTATRRPRDGRNHRPQRTRRARQLDLGAGRASAGRAPAARLDGRLPAVRTRHAGSLPDRIPDRRRRPGDDGEEPSCSTARARRWAPAPSACRSATNSSSARSPAIASCASISRGRAGSR